MIFRMLGLRIDPPGPFWFEDLMFFVADESRRLPARAAATAQRMRELARKASAFDPRHLFYPPVETEPVPAVVLHREVPPLDDTETWALATEPLTTAGSESHTAIAMHRAAAEQLDALTYVLDRMRDELRPMMTYARFTDDNLHVLPDRAAFETSLEALLELSRQNEATRPKDRVRTAA